MSVSPASTNPRQNKAKPKKTKGYFFAFLVSSLFFIPFLAVLVATCVSFSTDLQHLLPPTVSGPVRHAARVTKSWVSIVANFNFGLSPDALFNEIGVVEHVRNTPDTFHNVTGVIDAVDAFGWSGNIMVNVGDVKGAILDKALRRWYEQRRARANSGEITAVELGTLLGYGSLRIVNTLRELTTATCSQRAAENPAQCDEFHLLSVDPGTVSSLVAPALADWAGLQWQGSRWTDWRAGVRDWEKAKVEELG